MDEKEKDEKRYMHIDTSCKLHENKNTGIAYKTTDKEIHKGLVLSKKLKKELKRDLNADKDYGRIYAICIHYLIKDDLAIFDKLVICGDEDYKRTKKYLDGLFEGDKEYSKKEIMSLYELRKTTGKKKLKSYADNAARAYRRRGLKSFARRQKSVQLNVVEINYKRIKEKWMEIERKCK